MTTGLTAAQERNLRAVVAYIKARKFANPKHLDGYAERVADIAIATVLVESNGYIYANRNVPASLKQHYDAGKIGSDHLSVGLFQQQTPMWGTVADCMDPAKSAAKFVDALERLTWTGWSNGVAAQKVQVSAYPDRYAQRMDEAIRIRKALWGGTTASTPAPAKPAAVAKAPKYPLPKGSYFGPRYPLSNKQSVSGYYSHKADLKRWQQRMHDRGWTINPDGLYGPQTAQVCLAFQTEKHLTRDRLIGPETWKAAWTEPVT